MTFPARTTGFGSYQARCQPGYCVQAAGPGTSRTERDIRELLTFVLGPPAALEDLPIGASSPRTTVDMAFVMTDEYANICALLIEYDGAGWHQKPGQQDRDRRKSEFYNSFRRFPMVRIREKPLEPLGDNDVQVPAGASAQLCAHLALLHINHRFDLGDARIKVRAFLVASSIRPNREHVACRECWHWERLARRGAMTERDAMPQRIRNPRLTQRR